MLDESKKATQSLTLWGAVGTCAVAMFSLFGIDVDAGAITKAVEAGALAATTALTIWGRIRAEKRIG